MEVGDHLLPSVSQSKPRGNFSKAHLSLRSVHIVRPKPLESIASVSESEEYFPTFAVFTFQVVEEQIDTLDTWVMQSFGTSVDADIRDFAKRWNTAKWDLAVQGKSGYEASMKYYEEGNRLLDRMSIERADPTKTPAY